MILDMPPAKETPAEYNFDKQPGPPMVSMGEIKELADWFGIGLGVFARSLGIEDQIIDKWDQGIPVVGNIMAPEQQLGSIAELKGLFDRGLVGFGEEADKERVRWFSAPNELLNSKTPLEKIHEGKADEVYGLARAIAEGVYF